MPDLSSCLANKNIMEDVPSFLQGFDISQHNDNTRVKREENCMQDQLILSFPIMIVPVRWGNAHDCAVSKNYEIIPHKKSIELNSPCRKNGDGKFD